MREIKFRAWDGNNMHENVVLVDGVAYKRGYFATIFADGAKAGTPMQYTGLKDKNGKEIYDGDIIRQTKTDRPYSSKAKSKEVDMIVEWYSGAYERNEKSMKLNPQTAENPSWFNQIPRFIAKPIVDSKFTHCAWSSFHDCEVIGNIYENPDLINV